ncbi:uncharacterized protein TNIN_66591, partial [Trichonephila inaurata madagascariensis]
VVFFCAALAAVSASGLIAAPLVNTGVSSRAQVQDNIFLRLWATTLSNTTNFRRATGSLNSRAEVGKVGIAAAPSLSPAPHIAAPWLSPAPAAIGGVYGYGAPLAGPPPQLMEGPRTWVALWLMVEFSDTEVLLDSDMELTSMGWNPGTHLKKMF